MSHVARSARWVRWGVPVLVAIAAPHIAGAACNAFGPEFGQYFPNCNGGYCYVVSPGQHTSQTLAGSFWSFGTGRATVGQGDDNGGLPLDHWLRSSGSNLYLLGNWGDSPGIDGCVTGHVAPGKTAEIMVASVSDESTGVGFFAVASARRATGAFPEFDFTFVDGGGVAQDIVLREIPRAHVVSIYPTTLQFVAPALSDISPGIYGVLTPEETVKGYRIYTRTTSPGSLKISDGWSPISGILPLNQGFSYALPSCPPTGRIHFGYTLVFDGDFETAHVGRYISWFCRYCEFNDADHDGYSVLSIDSDGECCPDPSVCNDCNDLDASIHPGATELCNHVDDNCNGAVDDDIALPGPVAALQLEKQPGATRLEWPPLAVATGYDVVRGDLTELAVSGGSYSAATRVCVANDVTLSHADDSENPDPGYGFWYLLRAGNCAGVGTYDDGSEVATRGPGIAASGHACP